MIGFGNSDPCWICFLDPNGLVPNGVDLLIVSGMALATGVGFGNRRETPAASAVPLTHHSYDIYFSNAPYRASWLEANAHQMYSRADFSELRLLFARTSATAFCSLAFGGRCSVAKNMC